MIESEDTNDMIINHLKGETLSAAMPPFGIFTIRRLAVNSIASKEWTEIITRKKKRKHRWINKKIMDG